MQSLDLKFYLLFLAIAIGVMVNKTEGIVSGQYTAPTEIPFIVSLRTNGQHFCGGSIISYYHILTAAHCLDLSTGTFIPGLSYVVGGTTMKHYYGTRYTIQNYVVHPNFIMHPATLYKYDIGIITLTNKIKISEHKKIIRMIDSPLSRRSQGIAAGWGDLYFNQRQGSNVLLKLQTTVMNGKECNKYRSYDQDTQSTVCSLVPEGRKGICQGDSGGPLVVDSTLVGIASNAILCAAGSPDTFTSVYFYKSWIKSVIRQTGAPGVTKYTPESDFYSKSNVKKTKKQKTRKQKTKTKKTKKTKHSYSDYSDVSDDRDNSYDPDILYHRDDSYNSDYSYNSNESDESEISYYEFENGVWNAISC